MACLDRAHASLFVSVAMRVWIASDHQGLAVKSFLSAHFSDHCTLEDLGPHVLQSVDYPEYARRLCDSITRESDRGILICGSGLGVSMVANRFPHIRAALCLNPTMAIAARRHEDANVLCLSAWFMQKLWLLETVHQFLYTEFSGKERHRKRIAMFA